MAKIRARRGSVAIDTVPLPERTAKGVINQVGGKYILEVEGRKFDLPVGPTLPEAEIKRFAGKAVTAFFSMKKPENLVAIGTWPTPERPRFRCVLCYLPAPDWIRRIDSAVREVAIREMVKAKIISGALGRALRAR